MGFTVALGIIFMLMLFALFNSYHENTPAADSNSQTTLLLQEIKAQLGDLTARLSGGTSQRTQQTIRDAAIQQKLSEIKLMLSGKGYLMPDAETAKPDPATQQPLVPGLKVPRVEGESTCHLGQRLYTVCCCACDRRTPLCSVSADRGRRLNPVYWDFDKFQRAGTESITQLD